mgnify:CR=1 FL=1
MRNLLFVLVCTVAACKEKATTTAATGSSAVPVQPAGSATPAGSGSAEPQPTPAPVERKPGKFTASELVEISRIKFDGFKNFSLAITDTKAQLRQERDRSATNKDLSIYATVTVNPCVDCMPMELPKWQAKADALKAVTVDAAIRDKTIFELGEAEISGKKMISGYQLGQVGMTYTHATTLWYNDGANEIVIIAQYADNPVKDAETMAKMVPRERLQDVAAMMMAEYLKRF